MFPVNRVNLFIMLTHVPSFLPQNAGPAQGEGLGASGPPLFEKKIIIIRNTHFQIKGWWNKNIRLADHAEASKFMIGPFRSSIQYHKVSLFHEAIVVSEAPRCTSFSLGKPQNDNLYKAALRRRLLRFHQPGDVVYSQTMFFYQGS